MGGLKEKTSVLSPLLSEVSEAFSRLNWTQKLIFMQTCINEFCGNRGMMKRVFLLWFKAMYPRSSEKAEIWIESRFKKDMSLKPVLVAYECASYLKIPRVMVPHLVKVAQRVKQRLRMRMKVCQQKSQKQSLKESLKQSSMPSSL